MLWIGIILIRATGNVTPIHEKALACIHRICGIPVLKGSGLHNKPQIFVLLEERAREPKSAPIP